MEISEALGRFVASPRRWLFVIIGTFVIGLATVLPLAEEYKELNDHREELAAEIVRAEAEAETLPRFEQRVDSLRVELASLESKVVSAAGIHEFRNEVVNMVRDCGCQVRRINTGDAQSRVWLKNDSPLESGHRAKKSDETPYLLESQPFSLAVTGTMPQLTDLLSRLYKQGKLAHTRQLRIGATQPSGVELELQLDLVLFDLNEKATAKAI